MLELKPERFGLSDYGSQTIAICGKAFVADMSGALYWPAEKMLIVADLHLGKGAAFAARGTQMLPPYDTRDTLLRLVRVIDAYDVQTVVALGDSFHDSGSFDLMDQDDRKILAVLQDERDWIWLSGNHDPEISQQAGGKRADVLSIGGIALRHEPRIGPVTHEIAGHLHPAAKVSLYGHTIRRPCFIGNSRRLILPAFGSFTGGLNVLDEAFQPLFGHDGFSIWLLGEDGLYPVATRRLSPDRNQFGALK
ncbi:MAG: ligase-associated DNA damage response endonuclease PdeM [Pseudomonadota bacterium]